MSNETNNNVVHVTDETFQSEVLDSKTPVLLDFWAEWCGPCRALSPILEDISKEYAGKVKVVKINVDDNPKISGEYSVRGIPTLILLKEGNILGTKVGSLPKSQLTTFIDSNI